MVDDRLSLTRAKSLVNGRVDSLTAPSAPPAPPEGTDGTMLTGTTLDLAPPQQRPRTLPRRLQRVAPQRSATGAGADAAAVLGTPAWIPSARSTAELCRATNCTAPGGSGVIARGDVLSATATASTMKWPLRLGPSRAGGDDDVSVVAVVSPSVAEEKHMEEVGVDEERAASAGGKAAGVTEPEQKEEEEEETKKNIAATELASTLVSVGSRHSALTVGRTAMGAAVAAAVGLPPSTRLPPASCASSSSAGCRSVQAMSAFSAASWCSSSFDGDNTRHGAPAVTVRSPASYFAGNCNG